MDGGHGQRVSRRARAICALADRPETSAVTGRTAALADLLLTMVSASQQPTSAVASSQPRSGPGPRRDASAVPRPSARSRPAAARSASAVASPACLPGKNSRYASRPGASTPIAPIPRRTAAMAHATRQASGRAMKASLLVVRWCVIAAPRSPPAHAQPSLSARGGWRQLGPSTTPNRRRRPPSASKPERVRQNRRPCGWQRETRPLYVRPSGQNSSSVVTLGCTVRRRSARRTAVRVRQPPIRLVTERDSVFRSQRTPVDVRVLAASAQGQRLVMMVVTGGPNRRSAHGAGRPAASARRGGAAWPR
jgi:hypothetical protein